MSVKSKNIHVLPTDKLTKISMSEKTNTMVYNKDKHDTLVGFINQNIYITSDEKFKDEDYYLNIAFDTVHTNGSEIDSQYCKKIILTTDQDLIKDGVQAINDEFLEWFVKNHSCEYVRIGKGYFKNDYEQSLKIIIPKEEPKQDLPIVNGSYGCTIQTKKQEPKQETLEEVAIQKRNELGLKGTIDGFIAGAKWQSERMYSEEEVKIILFARDTHHQLTTELLDIDEWFEQFKKK